MQDKSFCNQKLVVKAFLEAFGSESFVWKILLVFAFLEAKAFGSDFFESFKSECFFSGSFCKGKVSSWKDIGFRRFLGQKLLVPADFYGGSF